MIFIFIRLLIFLFFFGVWVICFSRLYRFIRVLYLICSFSIFCLNFLFGLGCIKSFFVFTFLILRFIWFIDRIFWSFMFDVRISLSDCRRFDWNGCFWECFFLRFFFIFWWMLLNFILRRKSSFFNFLFLSKLIFLVSFVFLRVL